ncbi:TetR/AcrR family transcriptional regulator [Paraliobacillus sp. JSM ZJ581]|uniref:TetR/AcrR family transcriptional regulator n=1 Tax=Paraliobacillus sp. JSM ZJ581 TaxID=3342118 RepID=UPI0035A8BC90
MRQQEKTKIVKENILNESLILFAEQGYEGTSLQDIMNKTGMSKGAIYHHFTGKEDILRKITENAQGKVRDFFEDVKSDNKINTREKILRIVSFLGNNSEHSNLIENRWIEKVPFALLTTLRGAMKDLSPILANILKQGIEKKDIKCDNPDFAAETILILVDVWLDPTIFGWNPKEVESRFDYLFNIINQIVPGLIKKEDIEQIRILLLQLYK